MRLLTSLIVIGFGLNTFAQTTTQGNWIHTEAKYSDDIGNAMSITNSFPKGGGTYSDAAGNTYNYVNFWYRLTNMSEVPMEFKLEFPDKPLTFFPSPNSHIRIYLPSETMTSEKITMFDYGLSNLKGYLDAKFDEPSQLEKTIKPKEEFMFYVSILIYQAQGSARASLVLKENNLFYHIRMDPNSDVIPCGQITFKK